MVAKEKGQALVEFIIFLPFMLMTFTVVLTLGNAINGSINQQKAVRGYYYHRLQNNSQITRRNNPSIGVSMGHYMIGWADYIEGSSPVAPCYKLKMPFSELATDVCKEAYKTPTTQFIRVGTVYGICGTTVFNTGGPTGMSIPAPTGRSTNPGYIESVISTDSCLIK